MFTVSVKMKADGRPVKRIPITVQFDDQETSDVHTHTDREGKASFNNIAGSGQVYVNERSHFQGHLEGDINIELWTLTDTDSTASVGAPSGIGGGSMAYPNMAVRTLMVEGKEIETCGEGYIVNPDQWTEAYARALAVQEEIDLTEEHWEVIRFLRGYYDDKHTQATVRDMIKHFRKVWGKEKGSNRYLHQLFLHGGPQKQGNRLAGLLRTKGEH